MLELVELPDAGIDGIAEGGVLEVDEVGGEPAVGTAVGAAEGAGAGAAVGAPAGAGAAGLAIRVTGVNRREMFFGMSTLSIPWIDIV